MARGKRAPVLIAYHGALNFFPYGGGGARERGLRASERLNITLPQPGITRRDDHTERD